MKKKSLAHRPQKKAAIPLTWNREAPDVPRPQAPSHGRLTTLLLDELRHPDGLATVAPEHPIWVDFANGMASCVSLTTKMLAGLVVSGRVTYHNEENGFCVLRIKARGHRELVTVIAHAAVIPAGEWVTASGE